MTRLFRLSVVTAIATYALIVLGGITRVSGSGLGCEDDWPLCQGKPYPPLNTLAIIEYMHRTVAATIGFLVLATLIGTLLVAGTSRRSRLLATSSLVLVVVQALLGAVTVWRELPPEIVTAHLGTAMIFFACTLFTAYSIAVDRDAPDWIVNAGRKAGRQEDRTFTLYARIGALIIFLLILTGGMTSTTGAALFCDEWPFCRNGQFIPDQTSKYTWYNLGHRTTAALTALTVAFILYQAFKRPVARAARQLASAAAIVIAFQILIGAAYVLTGGDAWLSAFHLGTAAALWAIALAIAVAAHQPAEERPYPGIRISSPARPMGAPDAVVQMSAQSHDGAHGLPLQASGGAGAAFAASSTGLAIPHVDLQNLRAVIAAYAGLTKPGILTLLLATTLGAMLVAAAAVPPLSLVLATMLGGLLAAGGANTLNCYIDRDIDAEMHRTRHRGTVTGLVSARAALIFGVTLTVLAVIELAVLVNWLAAALALIGNLYYVLIYTRLLKRRTPQNIVIGGAAGAVPPLVGWAAVTGTLSVPAFLLFAIIYYWTPPHFWALALLKQGEYGRAAVPMLPVVAGEAETRRQVVLYSLLMTAVSFMLVPFGFGLIYLVGAVVINGVFLWLAVALYRSPSKRLARRLFFYSLWYLALIFAAMVIDRLLLA
jgi:protoheme IX farnesyltransferase